eukprot:CAMPEP_0182435878 /NCGR_PEP_ID=MMETSP1167-20130531/78119_1 /TAXON_ID=2988 /ORGANISM="Mallomonas Sp, Strain CCMP3275" /LENGTH=100 /DNA_ID=CAMNT_0024627379 /DNA_START=44 /DNA_END=343 /DNA_ORIENTATION=-
MNEFTEGEYTGYESSVSLITQLPYAPEMEEIFYEDFVVTTMRHVVDGSNSNIFKTTHKNMGKTKFIVKIIKKNPPDATHAWREFSIEHEVLSRLSHPNIV